MTKSLIASARWVAPLVRAGLIVGIATAVLIYPLVALGGLTAKAGTDAFNSLPTELTTVRQAQASTVYAADGTTPLTMFYEEYRRYVPISDVSPYMSEAIVSAEDGRFYRHHGVDPKGVARAFVANRQAGEVSQGGSTLTMQYVRDALRDSARTPRQAIDATEQTPSRKIREMRYAIELEKRLTKQEILERYLNIAYFGHDAYGIYAASQIFFSKPPNQLTLPEAALLAGLVKAPTAYDPASTDTSDARARRDWVLTRMQTLGYIPPSVAEQARQQPIKLKLSSPPNDCISVSHNDWGFFCDMFRQWWMSQPAFGDNPQDRLETLRRGGWRIVSSLDPAVQSAARQQVIAKEPVTSKFAHGLVMVEPGSGLIKAMAVNRVYSFDQSRNGPSTAVGARGVRGTYPNTVNMLLGGGSIGYQAGSTFKMFTMLAALEHGMPLSTEIYAPYTVTTNYLTSSGPARCAGDKWCPSNASGAMTGWQSMWSGFGKSVNTYWVQVEERVGAANAVQMAQRLGLTWHNAVDERLAKPENANGWGPFTLGVADTTPLEMANAYATVAANGVYCEPLPVRSITAPDGSPAMMSVGKGKAVPVASPRCHQAVAPEVAHAAADAARCTTGYKAATGDCGGWSTASGVYRTVGRPVAGKTGTTDNTAAAWFIGFTPQLAAAAFISDPDNPGDGVGDRNSQKPVEAVANTLKLASAALPVRDFTPPPSRLVGKAQRVVAPPAVAPARPARPAPAPRQQQPPAQKKKKKGRG
ncbi:MAG TPA: transglycosylase domain-containing protein [Micromonosporaceae bacterium]